MRGACPKLNNFSASPRPTVSALITLQLQYNQGFISINSTSHRGTWVKMLQLFSPAKLNLFLSVMRRREDGYHDLASLFHAVDLGDRLTLQLSDEDRLSVTGPFASEVPLDASNLIIKAAAHLRRKTGLDFAIDVLLEKNIPIQSGLGGGSSNAATTLWGLNRLLGYPASMKELVHWSAEIGSDITFFLSHGTAYCTGRGEVVRPLDPLPEEFTRQRIVIVKPPQGLSTPAVFRALEHRMLLMRDPQLALKNCFSAFPSLYNDLEAPAFTLMPYLEELKSTLKDAGFEHVVMSGSGTSFFCIGDGRIPYLPNHFLAETKLLRREEFGWYS